jgi:5-methylcytosine-specific restriction endonuclease McrA
MAVDCEHCGGTGTISEHDYKAPCPYCLGKGELPPAEVFEYYDIAFRDSMGREYYVPAVIRNRTHVTQIFRTVPFSRQNVFKRDNFTCQYCGKKMGPTQLTLDHVVPRSMWSGKDTPTCWHNIVAACRKCNAHKDNRTPGQAEMQLRKTLANGTVVEYKRPKPANHTEIVLGLTTNNYPDEWERYVQSILSSKKLAK